MRRAARAFAVLGGTVAAAALLLVATPAGPPVVVWLAARQAADRGWTLAVTGEQGSLLTGAVLTDVSLADSAGAVHLVVPRFQFSLSPYAVRLQAPQLQVQVRPAAAAGATAPGPPPRLPVAWLPDLEVAAGHLEVVWPGTNRRLTADSLAVVYAAQAETLGRAQVQLGAIQCRLDTGAAWQGRATLALRVEPARLTADSLQVVCARAALQLRSAAQLTLALAPGLPVQGSVEMHAAQLDQAGQARVAAQGQLQPLRLALSAQASADDPRLGPLALTLAAHVDTQAVRLDSVRMGALDGDWSGQAEYWLRSDSAAAHLTARGVELARLLPAVASGRVDADADLFAHMSASRLDATIHLESPALALVDGPTTPVELDLRLTPDHRLTVALASRLVRVQVEGTLDLAMLPGPGSYDLTGRGELDPSPWIGGPSAPLYLRLAARPDTVRAWADATALPGDLGRGFGPAQATAELLANRFLRAQVDVEQGLLTANLELDVTGEGVDTVTVWAHGVPAGRLVPGLRAAVQGQIGVGGLLAADGPRYEAHLRAPELAYDTWSLGPVQLDGTGRAGVAAAALQATAARLEGALDGDGQLRLQLTSHGRLLQRTGPAGATLDLVGRATWQSGLGEGAEARASADIDSLSWQQPGLAVRTRAPLRLRLERGRVWLDQVRLQTPIGPLEAAGSLAADSLAVRAALPALDLGPLVPGWSQTGGAAHLVLGGSQARPQLTMEAALGGVTLDSVAWGDLRLQATLADTARAELELLQGQPTAPAARFDLRLPGAPLWGGRPPTAADRASLALWAEGVDLAAPLSAALGQPTGGRLSVAGQLAVPLAVLDSAWQGQGLEGGLRFSELRLQTQLDGDSLRLDLEPGGQVSLADDRLQLRDLQVDLWRRPAGARAFTPSGRLKLAGGVDPDSGAQLEADLADVDLALFGGPAGRGSLQARVQGTLGAPLLTADLAVATDDLGQVRGWLRGARAGARFGAFWLPAAGDSLVLDGELPWDLAARRVVYEQAQLHLHSSGLDLGVLEPLVPQLDHLGGQLRAEVQARGWGPQLDLQGQVEVADLQVGLLDIKPVYGFTGGRLVLAGQRGELQGFDTVQPGVTGTMQLSGGVDLRSSTAPQFQLRLQTTGLPCQYLDLFRAPAADMDLTFAGSAAASRATGTVRLRQAVAEPMLVNFNAPPVPPPPPTLRDPFLENLELGIQIDIRDLKVESELADVQVSGVVDVGGTFYKPVFQGDIGIDKGQVYVLNRQFDFDRGRIVLNSLVPTRSLLDVAYDPFLLNPDLDLSASCKVSPIDETGSEYTVTLALQGPVQTAAPEFSSDPALDSNGIFRLLAFGSVASQLQYSAALGTAAGQLLSKKVEKVGLDEFMVLPSTRADIGLVGQPSLRLGKYFGWSPFPLWVRYEAAVNEMSSGEVRAEHQIKSYLTLSGSAQSRYNRYGLGLGLKKDF